MKTKTLFTVIATLAIALVSCKKDKATDNEKTDDDNFVISTSHNGVVDGEYGGIGEMTVNCNYTTANLQIDQVVIKYNIGYFLGDVTWTCIMKWEGEGNIYDLKWVAQVLDANNEPIMHEGQVVYCTITVGVIPDAGEGYGWDVTGSPYWDKVFKYYNSETNELINGISKEDAKAIYKADFVLGNIIILEINDAKL